MQKGGKGKEGNELKEYSGTGDVRVHTARSLWMGEARMLRRTVAEGTRAGHVLDIAGESSHAQVVTRSSTYKNIHEQANSLVH